MTYEIYHRIKRITPCTDPDKICSGKLAKAYPEHTFEIQIIKTKGDKIQNKPLDKIGGKGLFVKEIEEKDHFWEIHMGVHSMKDMPSTPAKGLVLQKVWKREDPRDVLILRTAKHLSELREDAVIATGSKKKSISVIKVKTRPSDYKYSREC